LNIDISKQRIQYMFVFYKQTEINHFTIFYNYKPHCNILVHFQIYQAYYAIMLIKMKFIEGTYENKVKRCFKSNICILINNFL